MPESLIPNELEAAILALYRAPLEEFVGQRDALVKQLRATKQRENADHVKALRKPSRMAWVLDAVVHEDPASLEQLTTAIVEAQRAIDLRAGLELINVALRAVAAAGARIAVRSKQPIEPNAIIAALRAVIGDAGAFAEWRAGRLIEVPEAGGLDMLTTLAVREPAKTPPPTAVTPPRAEIAKPEPRAKKAVKDAVLAKARTDLRQAETSLAKVREQSERAARSVLSAEEKLDAANDAVLRAQAEAQARRSDLDRARVDAEAAVAAVQDAERVVASARARVVEVDGVSDE